MGIKMMMIVIQVDISWDRLDASAWSGLWSSCAVDAYQDRSDLLLRDENLWEEKSTNIHEEMSESRLLFSYTLYFASSRVHSASCLWCTFMTFFVVVSISSCPPETLDFRRSGISNIQREDWGNTLLPPNDPSFPSFTSCRLSTSHRYVTSLQSISCLQSSTLIFIFHQNSETFCAWKHFV